MRKEIFFTLIIMVFLSLFGFSSCDVGNLKTKSGVFNIQDDSIYDCDGIIFQDTKELDKNYFALDLPVILLEVQLYELLKVL